MRKRLLVISAAVGTIGLAAYSLAPTTAGGAQLSAGLFAIPAATDSSIILVEDKHAKKKAGGSSGSAGSSSGNQQFRMQSNRQFKPQFNQQSSGNQQFRQQFRQQGSGNQLLIQQGSSGNWQGGGNKNWQSGNWQGGVNRNWQSRSSGRWANRTQWGGGSNFWYRNTSIVGFYFGDVYYPRRFVVGDDCLDYQLVWSPRRQSNVWRWVWICDDLLPYDGMVPYSGGWMPY